MHSSSEVKARKMVVRRALTLLVAAVLVFVAAACSADSDSDSGGGGGDGFSYTDARGEKIELDATPTKIAMNSSAAAALMPYGIKPVAIWASGEPEELAALEGLDLSGVEVLGTTYGKVDVDKLSTLEPELVITSWHPGEYLGGLGKVDDEVSKDIAKLAPIMTVSAQEPASASLDDWRKVAEQLGADVNDGTIADQKAAYDTAVADLKKATAAHPGVSAYAVSPSSQFFVAVPDLFAELRDYTAWGLDVRKSDVAQDESSGAFSPVSWEDAGDYTSDILLYDGRPNQAPPLETVVKEHPTVATLDTVKDDHVVEWVTDATLNYATYTKQIKELTAAIEKLPAA